MFDMEKVYKNCERCGVKMYVMHQQKYCCKECQQAAQKIRDKARAAETRKKDNGKALADIVRKAKAEGLTYGQYVAKYGL